MAIEIRLLQDSEIELANNFFNTIYKTNRSLDDFRWEFLEGPKGKALYVVAVDNSEVNFVKIVGIQCAIPLELSDAEGETILTAKSEDTLVHPEYRGQKLFERMYDLLFDACKKAGIKYIWGFTPALKAFERVGFEAPFKTTQAIMVIHPLKAYRYLVGLNPSNTLTEKWKIFGLSILSFFNSLRRFLVNNNSAALREIHPSDKNPILKSFYSGSPYYFLHQNNAYLNWRLIRNPLRNQYKNIFAGEGNAGSADILINIRENVSYIEQQFFHSKLSVESKLAILKKVVQMLIMNRAPLIRVLSFENNEEMVAQGNLLKKLGFVYLKRGDYFVWKSLDKKNTILAKQIFFSRLFTQGNK